jgi:hypothetical protein
MEKLTPENLREIFLDLQAAGLEAVVVGGQAVNLWAYQYCEAAIELKELLPFASEDLDFYGGRVEAVICKEALGGKVKLNKDFDPSPNAGVVLVNRQDKVLRIDFLASVYGLNDAEITGTALPFLGQDKLAGIQVRVLHPVLCLEGKLRCLRGLPQGGRQDLKHVVMSTLCVKELLRNLIRKDEPRSGLKLVERVLGSALREDGLSAWYHHGICIESAIPIDTLRELTDEKWQRFCETRFPQVMEQVSVKQNRYLEIMNRIKTRTTGQPLYDKNLDLEL